MLEIEKFEVEIKKGLLNTIYFCYATESYFLFEALRLVRKYFDSIAIETYESPEEVDVTSLMTAASLFSEKRILIVYNFEKIKKSEKRIEWLEKILSTASFSVTLIIVCNTSSKEILKEIDFLKKNKQCKIYNLDIYERELSLWVTYKATENKLNLKSDAIYYLIDVTGGQPGLISSEIEKIALLTDKSTVGLFDIKDILSEMSAATAFDLVDAIQKKEKEKAFKLLEKLKDIEPDMILGALNWYYTNRTSADSRIYGLLYKTNISLRQARACSLEMLVYELLKN